MEGGEEVREFSGGRRGGEKGWQREEERDRRERG